MGMKLEHNTSSKMKWDKSLLLDRMVYDYLMEEKLIKLANDFIKVTSPNAHNILTVDLAKYGLSKMLLAISSARERIQKMIEVDWKATNVNAVKNEMQLNGKMDSLVVKQENDAKVISSNVVKKEVKQEQSSDDSEDKSDSSEDESTKKEVKPTNVKKEVMPK